MSAQSPTIVLVLFDAKNKPTFKATPLQPDASGLIGYITRIANFLEHEVHDQAAVLGYVHQNGDVGAFAHSGFHTDTLAGMARELALDAKLARPGVRPALSHGSISLKLKPGESSVAPKELLEVGHAAMKLLGVNQNRYVLAVHIDTDHIHLHFLYSRVAEGGVLRERSRKYSKFLCEAACASLAYEFEFALEKRHLSRGDANGVLDLASERYTHDADFTEIKAGAEMRTKARAKIAARPEPIQELIRIALVARYEARGDLTTFRTLLAEEGISYSRKGSGAAFVDGQGVEYNASDVDARFSPTNIGLAGVAPMSLPDEPGWITAKIAERRQESLAIDHLVPDTDAAQEWNRFKAARDQGSGPYVPLEQSGRIDHDIKRSFRKNGAGRPLKAPLPDHWPVRAVPAVSLGAATFAKRRVTMPGEKYTRMEQPSRTEFWRGDALVATVRYSIMMVYSKQVADLEAALMAAHRAWGPVEVFGNKRFKAKMVKLAAQLDVPLSNPELQVALEAARSALGKPPSVAAREHPLDRVRTDEGTGPIAVSPIPIQEDASQGPSENVLVPREGALEAREVHVGSSRSADEAEATVEAVDPAFGDLSRAADPRPRTLPSHLVHGDDPHVVTPRVSSPLDRQKDTRDAAQAAPIQVALPRSSVAVKSGPAEPPPPATAATHPRLPETLASAPAGDLAGARANPDQSIIDRTAEAPATKDHQQTHVEPSAPPGGTTVDARTSLLVEKVPPQAPPRISGMEVAAGRKPPAPNVTGTEPENTQANIPSKAAHVPPSLGESAKAASTASRAGIRASLTDAEIAEILRPRLVGADGVFRPREELDQISVAKVIWAYGDLSPRARAGLGAADLYATAEGHRQADDLRVALARGRTRLREETSRGPSNPRPQPESVLTDQDRAKQAQMQAALHAQQGRGGI
ncbi:MAG TPA: relaxase/mobilization nuclease domain-containing protein [Allosphingosinicella sp.]|jgi:hypothetical protein